MTHFPVTHFSVNPIDTFITRWENSGAAERANYALFLTELCDPGAGWEVGRTVPVSRLGVQSR